MRTYHGTTKKSLNEILKTQNIECSYFDIKKDGVIPKGQRLVNDLGNGFYLFLETDRYDALENAKKYAAKYKEPPIGVIEVIFSDSEEMNILDMNEKETQAIFVEFRESVYEKIFYNYSQNVKKDGAKNRANLDGIFLEYIIKYKYDNKVDGVICDTFTPFYNSEKQLSNFPNGCELCLRNLKYIDWDLSKEVI